MSSSDWDSGVAPWRPPLEVQRQDREERRLIYNQFSTAELKRIEPKAFEPSAALLCLQLIETKRGAEFYRNVYSLTRSDQREIKLTLQYSINAHDRAADVVSKRLGKALKALGYEAGDEDNTDMLKLAEAGKLGQLSAYIFDNSPMVKQVINEDWKTGNG